MIKQPVYRYSALVLRVVDGDTLDAEINLGFYTKITKRFRMAKINAPELKGESAVAGAATKEWLKNRIEGKTILLDTHKGEDKYGRWICFAFDELCLDDKSINEEMVELGLAISYM